MSGLYTQKMRVSSPLRRTLQKRRQREQHGLMYKIDKERAAAQPRKSARRACVLLLRRHIAEPLPCRSRGEKERAPRQQRIICLLYTSPSPRVYGSADKICHHGHKKRRGKHDEPPAQRALRETRAYAGDRDKAPGDHIPRKLHNAALHKQVRHKPHRRKIKKKVPYDHGEQRRCPPCIEKAYAFFAHLETLKRKSVTSPSCIT